MTFLGPYLVAAALLVLAGAAKAWRPLDTARAVKTFWPRLPFGLCRAAVRTLALVEMLVGLAAIVVPESVASLLVVVSYAVFTVVVVVARARGGVLASCGCFGTPDTPPTVLHAAVDAALAGLVIPVAARGLGAGDPFLWAVLRHTPLHGAALVALAIVATWIVYLLLAQLPRLQALQSEVGP